MPLKTPIAELIQEDENAASSPVRRSNRIASISKLPSSITTRRTSEDSSNGPTGLRKSRRLSQSQENGDGDSGRGTPHLDETERVSTPKPRKRRGSTSSLNEEKSQTRVSTPLAVRRSTRSMSKSPQKVDDPNLENATKTRAKVLDKIKLLEAIEEFENTSKDNENGEEKRCDNEVANLSFKAEEKEHNKSAGNVEKHGLENEQNEDIKSVNNETNVKITDNLILKVKEKDKIDNKEEEDKEEIIIEKQHYSPKKLFLKNKDVTNENPPKELANDQSFQSSLSKEKSLEKPEDNITEKSLNNSSDKENEVHQSPVLSSNKSGIKIKTTPKTLDSENSSTLEKQEMLEDDTSFEVVDNLILKYDQDNSQTMPLDTDKIDHSSIGKNDTGKKTKETKQQGTDEDDSLQTRVEETVDDESDEGITSELMIEENVEINSVVLRNFNQGTQNIEEIGSNEKELDKSPQKKEIIKDANDEKEDLMLLEDKNHEKQSPIIKVNSNKENINRKSDNKKSLSPRRSTGESENNKMEMEEETINKNNSNSPRNETDETKIRPKTVKRLSLTKIKNDSKDETASDIKSLNNSYSNQKTIKYSEEAETKQIKNERPSFKKEAKEDVEKKQSSENLIHKLLENKLNELIKKKINNADDSSEDSESDVKSVTDFLDDMAEEGEETDASNDSNEIVDEGESIGFSSSDEQETDDDSYDGSFINDEETSLLSGEELNLKEDNKTTNNAKGSKWKRIIKQTENIDENESEELETKSDVDEKKTKKNEKLERKTKEDETVEMRAKEDEELEKESKDEKLEKDSKGEELQKPGIETEETIIPELVIITEQIDQTEILPSNKTRSSISICENLSFDDVKDRIEQVVELFSSSVTNSGRKVSLNLSLNYESETEKDDEVVKESKSYLEIVDITDSQKKQKKSKLSTSLGNLDLGNQKNKRLKLSFDDILNVIDDDDDIKPSCSDEMIRKTASVEKKKNQKDRISKNFEQKKVTTHKNIDEDLHSTSESSKIKNRKSKDFAVASSTNENQEKIQVKETETEEIKVVPKIERRRNKKRRLNPEGESDISNVDFTPIFSEKSKKVKLSLEPKDKIKILSDVLIIKPTTKESSYKSQWINKKFKAREQCENTSEFGKILKSTTPKVWIVEDVASPSSVLPSESRKNKMKKKNEKEKSTSKFDIPDKRDFKTKMLFDSNRVKRMETEVLLKKKKKMFN